MKRICPVVLIFSILLASCNSDPAEPEIVERIDPFESEAISKIAQISSVTDQIWTGFNLMDTHPVYLIVNVPQTIEPRGYLFNPPDDLPSGSFALSEELSAGLNVFRNDRLTGDALDFLDMGSFAFDYDIDGESYLLIRFLAIDNFYNNYKNRDNNWIPVVILHELFHVHQQDLTRPANAIQDFFGYPLTTELIAHHLLLWDVMNKAYGNSTEGEFTESLELYLAIREEIFELDPSTDKLAHNIGTSQEWLEGAARYIEYYSALNSIDPTIGQDPTQGWSDFLDEVTDELSVRQALVQRTWYHVGAVVIHMLRSSGVDVETLMSNGQTPYQITGDFLNLSDAELDMILEEKKAEVDWAGYVERAEEIFALLE